MPYLGGVQRSLLAVAAGVILWLSFPGIGWWVCAPIGLALFAISCARVTPWRGAGLGLLTGLAFFVPTLSWSGIYLGVVPWFALAALQALSVAGAGAMVALLSPTTVRPVAFAVAWVGAEAVRSRWPYGGFPWVPLAASQADSPLGHLAALGGTPVVGFAVALSGGLLASAVISTARRPVSRGPARWGQVRPRWAAGMGAVAVAGAGLLVPLPTDGPTVRVLAVQGNVPAPGLDFNAERRAVLDLHGAATERAAADVAAGQRDQPDVVLWPENASDIDPSRNEDAEAVIERAVDAINAPVVVGTLRDRPDGIRNVSVTYLPGRGAVAEYVKQHPVPFAEYIPDRAFWRRFSTQVDLLPRDFVAGTGRGIVAAATASGTQLRAGLLICFEVAYADLVRDAVTHGANLLVVQTNNATFGFSAESVQQLALSRLRAIEHGRSVVQVSTVGVSGLITPDGTVHDATALFTQALLSGDLPMRQTLTVASRVGPLPEYAALAVLIGLVGLRLARRSGHTALGVDTTEGRSA
jgi:apolipoprotein N-acyltransferase